MRRVLPVVAGIVLVFAGCARKENGAAAAADDRATPSVPVVTAGRTDIAESLTLTGEFIPYQEVDLIAKVAGYVREISVDVGDRVRRGQIVAGLEIPEMLDDLTRASASIEQASAEMTRAEDEVRRAEAAHQMAHLSLTRIESVAKRAPGLV